MDLHGSDAVNREQMLEDKIAEEADNTTERDVVTVQEATDEKETAPEEADISNNPETHIQDEFCSD